MVGRIPMRTELAKNRPYISGKIWPFWIGHCSALSSVLLQSVEQDYAWEQLPVRFPRQRPTGHCSTHRDQILAVGRHWLPADASTKSSANLQLLAVQPVRGQSQTRQYYLVEIVLLVQIPFAPPQQHQCSPGPQLIQHLPYFRDASLSVRFQPPLGHRKCLFYQASLLNFIIVCVHSSQWPNTTRLSSRVRTPG